MILSAHVAELAPWSSIYEPVLETRRDGLEIKVQIVVPRGRGRGRCSNQARASAVRHGIDDVLLIEQL